MVSIVAGIIADAYLEAKCTSDNVPAESAIRYCDDIYQELIDEKKLINEDFIKEKDTLDTKIFTNKYLLPSDFEKMTQVSIKYTAPTYDAWVAGTVYAVGDKCIYNGKSYVCNLAHTAGSIFEYTKTFTTTAIMVAGDTITINGVIFTAKAVGACTNPGDFYIGLDETAGNINLYNCIKSLTAGSATTFIALSNYNKKILSKAEIVATNSTIHTIEITSNESITASDTSATGSRGAETGGNWIQIFENYIPCTPMMVDFDFQRDFNNISAQSPVYFYENNKLNIYPRPQEVVVQGILFDYIPSQETLTLITDDGAINIENKLHDARVSGVAMKFQDHMEKDSSKLNMDYQKGIMKCKNWRKNRHYAPVVEQLPSSLLRYMR